MLRMIWTKKSIVEALIISISLNDMMQIVQKVDPAACSVNMVYVPEEEACECEIGTLYHGPTDRCYVPFQEGPCSSGEHLVLPRNSDIAKCVVNTCGNNGTLPYKNICIQLLKPGDPCPPDEAMVVDQETYELTCQMIISVSHQIITAPVRGCLRGSRKIASGKCRAILWINDRIIAIGIQSSTEIIIIHLRKTTHLTDWHNPFCASPRNFKLKKKTNISNRYKNHHESLKKQVWLLKIIIPEFSNAGKMNLLYLPRKQVI